MIQEKLQKARLELQNKSLKKSGKNKFAGFTYYELADFLPSVNQIFYDLKIFSNFSIKEGQATLTVTDWEDKTQEVFTSPIEELELKGCSKVQALGGVHTYLKRYLYLNALEIIEFDMLDAKAGDIEEKPIKKAPKKKQISDADLEYFEIIASMNEVVDVQTYYEQTKAFVENREEYHTLACDRIKAIKNEIKEKK